MNVKEILEKLKDNADLKEILNKEASEASEAETKTEPSVDVNKLAEEVAKIISKSDTGKSKELDNVDKLVEKLNKTAEESNRIITELANAFLLDDNLDAEGLSKVASENEDINRHLGVLTIFADTADKLLAEDSNNEEKYTYTSDDVIKLASVLIESASDEELDPDFYDSTKKDEESENDEEDGELYKLAEEIFDEIVESGELDEEFVKEAVKGQVFGWLRRVGGRAWAKTKGFPGAAKGYAKKHFSPLNRMPKETRRQLAKRYLSERKVLVGTAAGAGGVGIGLAARRRNKNKKR